ncbi:uncharacterized protein LOC141856295 isoform X2 [Brevipalpus obovatus]
MWIYGGMTDLQEKGDFWKWNLELEKWTKVKCKKGPGALHSHSAIKAFGFMFVFGGEREGQLKQDLWRYQFKSNVWEKIVVEGLMPNPRCRHTAIPNPTFEIDAWDNEDENCFSIKSKSSYTLSKSSSTKSAHMVPPKSISMCFGHPNETPHRRLSNTNSNNNNNNNNTHHRPASIKQHSKFRVRPMSLSICSKGSFSISDDEDDNNTNGHDGDQNENNGSSTRAKVQPIRRRSLREKISHSRLVRSISSSSYNKFHNQRASKSVLLECNSKESSLNSPDLEKLRILNPCEDMEDDDPVQCAGILSSPMRKSYSFDPVLEPEYNNSVRRRHPHDLARWGQKIRPRSEVLDGLVHMESLLENSEFDCNSTSTAMVEKLKRHSVSESLSYYSLCFPSPPFDRPSQLSKNGSNITGILKEGTCQPSNSQHCPNSKAIFEKNISTATTSMISDKSNYKMLSGSQRHPDISNSQRDHPSSPPDMISMKRIQSNSDSASTTSNESNTSSMRNDSNSHGNQVCSPSTIITTTTTTSTTIDHQKRNAEDNDQFIHFDEHFYKALNSPPADSSHTGVTSGYESSATLFTPSTEDAGLSHSFSHSSGYHSFSDDNPLEFQYPQQQQQQQQQQQYHTINTTNNNNLPGNSHVLSSFFVNHSNSVPRRSSSNCLPSNQSHQQQQTNSMPSSSNTTIVNNNNHHQAQPETSVSSTLSSSFDCKNMEIKQNIDRSTANPLPYSSSSIESNGVRFSKDLLRPRVRGERSALRNSGIRNSYNENNRLWQQINVIKEVVVPSSPATQKWTQSPGRSRMLQHHWQLCMYVFGGREQGSMGPIYRQPISVWKFYV